MKDIFYLPQRLYMSNMVQAYKIKPKQRQTRQFTCLRYRKEVLQTIPRHGPQLFQFAFCLTY